MARLKLDWTPDQVTRLPFLTKAVLEVTPRAAAEGIRITYRLVSPRLRFRPGSADVLKAEADDSSPVFTPVSRAERVIEDDYPATAKNITRALSIEQVGSEKPGVATLKGTAEDIIGGVPQNPGVADDSISFVLS